jgi:hypothetical protein
MAFIKNIRSLRGLSPLRNVSTFSNPKFFNHNSLTIFKIPYLKVFFNDNPYLLKDYIMFDYYSIKLPLHIYIRNLHNNSISVYSLCNNNSTFLKNSEYLKDDVDIYFQKIKNIFDNYTINNQNITIDYGSTETYSHNIPLITPMKFPFFIYPRQYKVNQYQNKFRSIKSNYDIKTLLTMNKRDGCLDNIISNNWIKIKEIDLNSKNIVSIYKDDTINLV